MKDEIKEKFSGIKHKWVYFHTDTPEFQYILDQTTKAINNKEIKSKDAIRLIKAFKFHEKAFVKYTKNIGRKNFKCICQLIDDNNNKLDIEFNPANILNANILSGTPKSLKLYKTGEKTKGQWKKPNDGFFDDIEYPTMEEELSELGYHMYKDWTEEVKASGLSSVDRYRQICGTLKYYQRN